MAHTTLINGTEYEITGGKALVNGTAYEITGGKTLVNGVAHEISFAVKMVTITVIEDIEASYQGVLVDHTKYTRQGQSVSVPVGTTIWLFGYQGVFEDGVLIGVCDTPGSSVRYTVNYDITVQWAPEGMVTIKKV